MKFLLSLLFLLLVGASAEAQQSYPLLPFTCPNGQFAYAFSPNTIGLNGWNCASPFAFVVTSVQGTAGQINVSPTTGIPVIGLPPTITESLDFTNDITIDGSLTLTDLSAGTCAFALSINSQGEVIETPCGGSSINWPPNNDLVVSNGTSSPGGLAPSINGDCAVVSGGVWSLGSCGSGGGVSNVSNSDSTLTISPNTGAVIASLNLGNVNTWTAQQSFTNGDLQLLGSSSGGSILEAPASGGGVVTLPGGTVGLLSNALPNTDFLVGNVSGIATPVSMGGSCSLSNTGVVTCNLGGTPLQTFTLSGNTTEVATVSGALTATHCVEIDASGNFVDAGGTCTTGGGGGTVTSGTGPAIAQYNAGTGTVVGPATVSGDGALAQGGALTISKIGGKAVALGGSLNTAANFQQTGAGAMTLAGPSGAATFTFPAASDTLAGLGTAQTFTAAQSFTNGDLQLLGSSSGHSTLEAPASGGGIITFPGGTATLLGNGLLSGDIFVGNGSNVATGVAMGGDVSLSNTGLTTVGALQGHTVPASATTDGQLLIGDSSTGNWDKATITAGSNVTVTNGHGTITIASTGGSSCPSGITTWDGTTNLTVSATIGTVYTIGSTPVAAPRTLTLPVASSFGPGCVLAIVDGAKIFNATNPVTPTRQSSDTIDGSTTGAPFEPSAAPIVQTAQYVVVASGLWNTLVSPSVGSFAPVSHQFLTGLSAAGFSAAAIGLTDLPSLSANQVLGALTATTPSGLSVPSCSTGSSALTWTSGTGFGCNTISGSGTVNSGTANQLAFYGSTGTAVSGNTHASETGSNLVVNYNAVAPPTPLGKGLQISSLDSSSAFLEGDAYGTNISPVFAGRRSLGTAASPSTLTDALTMSELTGGGWDGSAWTTSPAAVFALESCGTWSSSSHCSFERIFVTPAASTTLGPTATFESDGTLFVGSNTSSTANNTGAGTVNAATGFTVNGVTTANKALMTPNGTTGVASLRSIVTADLPVGTSGATIPLLNGNNTYSGINTHTGSETFGQVQGTNTTQSGTTYTFAATDCGTEVIFTSTSTVTATIPASIVPAAGTSCVIGVNQAAAGHVLVNGSAVTPATLVSAHSYTGTFNAAGAEIALRLTTISSVATATLLGDGS